jgi:dienelactone hydrolase/predicted small lipoprotein YifL
MKRAIRWASALVLVALLAACGAQAPEAAPTPTESEAAMTPEATATPEATERETDLVARAEALVDALAAGDVEAATAYFDQAMAEALPAEKLTEVWDQLTTQVGTFQARLGTRTETQEGYEIVYVVTAFERAPLDVKVVFDSGGEIAGLFFEPSQGLPEKESYAAPDYANLDAIEEDEVTVGTGEWALPGTLTMPLQGEDLPAVVLVHGTGPQDRDESIGPNRPFRDLAWGLASQGVAVLRYEKRTKEHAAQVAANLDQLTVYEETIEDALAAAALLRETPRIDPDRIFVLGHGLGGMVAPRIGALDEDLAGLIILAGNTRPLEDMILDQVAYLGTLQESISEEDQAAVKELEAQVARVKDPNLSADTPAADLLLGIPAGYWLDLRDYHPAEAARELAQPMLILQGGRDYQVTEVDFEGWQATLDDHPDVTFKLYPDLNHLFMVGEGMSVPAEYDQPGNVAGPVISDIAAWILAH